jgi:PAS domain S-box-containing protein
MVAVLGLGRTRDGSLLSSEDLDILRTVSGYVAVAVENSLLYEEQQRRTEELALLKEFNESIVESVNVALLAVDGEGIVTRCNSTAESLFGVSREGVIGHRVEDLFAEDFAETLAQLLGKTRWHLSEVRHAYKLYAARRDGKSFILNTAVAPLRSPAGERTGAILVLEDITSRVTLEEQLQQREKLSSIGMLAAGRGS